MLPLFKCRRFGHTSIKKSNIWNWLHFNSNTITVIVTQHISSNVWRWVQFQFSAFVFIWIKHKMLVDLEGLKVKKLCFYWGLLEPFSYVQCNVNVAVGILLLSVFFFFVCPCFSTLDAVWVKVWTSCPWAWSWPWLQLLLLIKNLVWLCWQGEYFTIVRVHVPELTWLHYFPVWLGWSTKLM